MRDLGGGNEHREDQNTCKKVSRDNFLNGEKRRKVVKSKKNQKMASHPSSLMGRIWISDK